MTPADSAAWLAARSTTGGLIWTGESQSHLGSARGQTEGAKHAPFVLFTDLRTVAR